MNKENEEIVKKIETKAGGIVSLVKPATGFPFFRYKAPAHAVKDTFRYIIKQYGLTDTASVIIQVDSSVEIDDQKKFNEEYDHVFNCITFFVNGSIGTKTLRNVFGIEQGEYLNNKWLDEVFNGIEKVFPPIKNGEFYFEKYVGVYNYKRDSGWQKPEPSKGIVINFPSSPIAEKNDVSLVIESYELFPKPFKDGESEFYLPVSFRAFLQLSGKDLFGAQLGKGKIPTQYHPSGVPIAFDLDVFVDPYQIKFVTTNEKAVVFKSSFSIKEKEECSLILNTEFVIEPMDTTDLGKFELRLKSIQGDLSLNGTTFSNLESLFKISQLKEKTQEAIDKVFDIGVSLGEKRIGKLAYVLDKEIIEIVFADGTRQDITKRLVDFFDLYFKKKDSESIASKVEDGSKPVSMAKSMTTTTLTQSAEVSKLEAIATGLKTRFAINLKPDSENPGSLARLFGAVKTKEK